MLAQVLSYRNNNRSCSLQLLGYYVEEDGTCSNESLHCGVNRHWPWQKSVRFWGRMTLMLGV
jgi:hypothetical protein